MKQKRARIPGSPPSLTVITPQNTTKVITAGKNILLLGATLQDNSTWQSHLETGNNALIPKIRKKLGAIKYIGRDLSKDAKQLLVNGYVLKSSTLPNSTLGWHLQQVPAENSSHPK